MLRNRSSLARLFASVILLVCIGVATPAQAKRVALLIGNAVYSVGSLVYPPADVKEMEGALNNLGFQVKKLLNGNQSQMKRAVRDFGTAAQGAEFALLYYSGHGTQVNGENYLLPVGTQIEKESDYAIEAIAANDVLQQLRGANPKAAILVLDACRDNPLAATTKSTSKGLSRMNAPVGTMIAFATSPGDTAIDNGNYARVLAREMQKPGVELVDVFRNTAAEVRRLSSASKPQDPRLSDVSLHDRVYLAGGPASTPAPVDADQLACDVARSGGGAAWRAYLQEFPNGRCASVARVANAQSTASSAPAPSSSAGPTVGSTIKDCDVCPELVVLPKGSFTMGSPANEAGRDNREGPQQWITIDRTLAVGKYEVTQGEWQAVMGGNPSRFKDCGLRCPVERVSWDDAKEYLRKLNERTGNRYGYRLLSEAEWEYAARAGCGGAFSISGQCKERVSSSEANFNGNYTYNDSEKGPYREKTIPVGSLNAANAWGLHDMHGNVWELVEDCRNDTLNGTPGTGAARTRDCTDASLRVMRGGSWELYPQVLRVAMRAGSNSDNRNSNIGFRVARSVNISVSTN